MATNPYTAPQTQPVATSPPRLTVIDWMGVGLAVLMIAILAILPVTVFRTMFRDAGVMGEVPLLTRVVLFPWFSVLSLPAIGALVLMAIERRRVSRRRKWILAAIVLGALGVPAFLAAMYLPVFTIAASLKPG